MGGRSKTGWFFFGNLLKCWFALDSKFLEDCVKDSQRLSYELEIVRVSKVTSSISGDIH